LEDLKKFINNKHTTMNLIDKRFMENCVFATEIKLFFDEIKRSDTPEVDLKKMEHKMDVMNI